MVYGENTLNVIPMEEEIKNTIKQYAFVKCPKCDRYAPVSYFFHAYRPNCICGCWDRVSENNIVWVDESRVKEYGSLVGADSAATRIVEVELEQIL